MAKQRLTAEQRLVFNALKAQVPYLILADPGEDGHCDLTTAQVRVEKKQVLLSQAMTWFGIHLVPTHQEAPQLFQDAVGYQALAILPLRTKFAGGFDELLSEIVKISLRAKLDRETEIGRLFLMNKGSEAYLRTSQYPTPQDRGLSFSYRVYKVRKAGVICHDEYENYPPDDAPPTLYEVELNSMNSICRLAEKIVQELLMGYTEFYSDCTGRRLKIIFNDFREDLRFKLQIYLDVQQLAKEKKD